MQLTGKIVALFFGIAMLGGIGFGALLALDYVVGLFASLDRQVAIVTGIACMVALCVSWVIARAIRASNQQSRSMALREEKTASYQLFLDYWENLFRQEAVQMDQLPAEFSEKLKVLERLLALYGGAAALKAHTSLRSVVFDKGVLHPDARARFGAALVAIRKDLGSDTPRNLAAELERLLLPVSDAGNDAAESRGAGSPAVVASAS